MRLLPLWPEHLLHKGMPCVCSVLPRLDVTVRNSSCFVVQFFTRGMRIVGNGYRRKGNSDYFVCGYAKGSYRRIGVIYSGSALRGALCSCFASVFVLKRWVYGGRCFNRWV